MPRTSTDRRRQCPDPLRPLLPRGRGPKALPAGQQAINGGWPPGPAPEEPRPLVHGGRSLRQPPGPSPPDARLREAAGPTAVPRQVWTAGVPRGFAPGRPRRIERIMSIRRLAVGWRA